MPTSSVQSILDRINKKGRAERHLKAAIRSDPLSSYEDLQMELVRVGFNVCRDTKREDRLLWSKERANWTDNQWNNVVWSDESRFIIHGNFPGRRVLRNGGGGGIMVWGCFWVSGFGTIAIVEEKFNQDVYIDTLAQTFHSWYQNLIAKTDKPLLLQEDGAICYTGLYARLWKEAHQIKGFGYWPAQSPDLNPIDHIWYSLEALVQKRKASIHSMEDLKVALKEEWPRMDAEFAKRLVVNMGRRYQAVIGAKGGPTRHSFFILFFIPALINVRTFL
ncbi:conserved hypothetical protein [Mucor ambiguus]|uniref:Tc1-like transposase DDE domain-containing protein n=1 Tax=Mucor ambiguus TaxID=91626 RepID=A0A0C9MKT7_9FUNG|nr:conserved hypothetical protein [Mucor ambiguus]